MGRTSTTWRKGQSGNPRGRPRWGESIAEALRAAGTSERRRKLAERAWELALQGDIRHMEFISDRLDGKPAQRQILEGGERPILVARKRHDNSD